MGVASTTTDTTTATSTTAIAAAAAGAAAAGLTSHEGAIQLIDGMVAKGCGGSYHGSSNMTLRERERERNR